MANSFVVKNMIYFLLPESQTALLSHLQRYVFDSEIFSFYLSDFLLYIVCEHLWREPEIKNCVASICLNVVVFIHDKLSFHKEFVPLFFWLSLTNNITSEKKRKSSPAKVLKAFRAVQC